MADDVSIEQRKLLEAFRRCLSAEAIASYDTLDVRAKSAVMAALCMAAEMFVPREDFSGRVKAIPSSTTSKNADKKSLVYRGAWRDGWSYHGDEVVTLKGAMWVAMRDTDARPGASSDWQLSVKSAEGTGNGDLR